MNFVKHLPLLCLSLLILSVPTWSNPPAVSLSTSDGAHLNWGDFNWRSGVILHADTFEVDASVDDIQTSDRLRRARLTNRLDWGAWRLRADYDFGISKGYKNLYLEYRGWDNTRIRAGNQTAPFSMEDTESSSDMVFMERSIASRLRPGLLQGVMFRKWGRHWSVSAGMFGDEINDLDRRRAPGESAISRVTFRPIATRDSHLHLGFAYEYRRIDSGEAVRLRARPFTRLAQSRILDTRLLTQADTLRNANQEFGISYRNLRLQAEATQSKVSTSAQSFHFSGHNVAITASLGAKPYKYSRSRGVFRSIQPQRDWGALEFGLRYADLDLNEGSVTGGRSRELTAGVSWIVNDVARLQFNYSQLDADPDRNGIQQSYDVLGLRLRVRI